MKLCSKCKIEKDELDFYIKKDRPCGYTSRCKNCINEINRIKNNLPENKLKLLEFRSRPENKTKKKLYDSGRKEYHAKYSHSERAKILRKINYNKPENKLKFLAKNKTMQMKLMKRRHAIDKKFNMTHEMYLEILKNQGGVCAICKTDSPGKGLEHFSIDHDHAKYKSISFRGLLCRSCNSGLGFFMDNIKSLKNAVTYLEERKSLELDPKITLSTDEFEVRGNFSNQPVT